MIIIYAILFASAGLSTLSEASAIKGHAQQQQPPKALEDVRAIKSAKSAPITPVLESSKKIYNDESIRRLAAPAIVGAAKESQLEERLQPEAAFVVSVKQQPEVAAAAPVVVVPAKVEAPVVVQKVAEPAFVQQAPAAALVAPEKQQSVVVKESPVVVVPEAKSAAAEKKEAEPKEAEPKFAPIEPKIAPVEPKLAEPAVLKPAEEHLPAQSERSAEAIEKQPAVEKKQEQVVAKAVEVAKESPLEEKLKQPAEQVAAPVPVAPVAAAPAPVEPLHIEVPAPDPGLVLSEPIDSTTKLLIDLDEHVQKFLPAEDQQQQPAQPSKEQVLVPGVDFSPASQGAEKEASGKSSAPLVPYSGLDEPIVPPLPSLDGVEKASGAPTAAGASTSTTTAAAAAAAGSSATRQGNNSPQNQQQVITQLLDQLDSLQNRIQDTINQLVARRRYVMSALLRPMGTYVRRVRTNLERLQTRVNQLQAAAVSVGGGNGPSRPGGFVDAAAIETIRRRIDDISKRISDIVNRIRFSLTPTSAPLNSNGRK